MWECGVSFFSTAVIIIIIIVTTSVLGAHDSLFITSSSGDYLAFYILLVSWNTHAQIFWFLISPLRPVITILLLLLLLLACGVVLAISSSFLLLLLLLWCVSPFCTLWIAMWCWVDGSSVNPYIIIIIIIVMVLASAAWNSFISP